MSTGCGDQGVGPEKRVVDVVARPAGRPPRFGGEGGSVHDELRAEMLRLMDDEEEPSCLDETLLCAEYARRALDAEGEWRAVESIVRSGEGDP